MSSCGSMSSIGAILEDPSPNRLVTRTVRIFPVLGFTCLVLSSRAVFCLLFVLAAVNVPFPVFGVVSVKVIFCPPRLMVN